MVLVPCCLTAIVHLSRVNDTAPRQGFTTPVYCATHPRFHFATSVSADEYRAALDVAGQVWHDHFGPLFREYYAFACPTVSCPEVPAQSTQKTPIIVNGKQITDTDTAMTALFNMYARCPALAVPSGMTDTGLPTSLQIVGRPHDDATVFRIGSALERLRPWLDTAERRPTINSNV